MRCRKGVIVWGLLVSSRYVLAQDATPTSHDLSNLRFRAEDNDAHQTIDDIDGLGVVASHSDSTTVNAHPITEPSQASQQTLPDRPRHTGTPITSHSHPHTATAHSAHPHLVPGPNPTPFPPFHNGPPGPQPPRPPQAGPASRSHRRITTVGLVFACLGGIAATLILFAMARCFYIWRRTPSRDRIAGLLQRHHLDREMEEREREDLTRRMREQAAPRWKPPPPPYQNAPAYDSVAQPPAVAQV
ncbi:hypothetical protein EIP91_008339 [Steccherinum ochraceum]|uniref:Mid2 domain-containing protein n=1 Tax=Steccherinum ochraceum TaxID=92696 RepID=A0A4R0RNJ1_9APHY|nr:hypothetical protein EIP91_008339 [Steccherinum ochraceum]